MTTRATSRTTRWHISISISRPIEERVTAQGGQVHLAVDADEARAIVLDICRKAERQHGRPRASRMISRGDRPQRLSRSQRHHAGRDRSRRIHHPASRRAPEPHHRAGGASQYRPGARATSAAPTPTCRRTGRPGRARHRCWRRRAACCAKNSLPPMSALPAPTSWSPRPAPRSSSPTRAMAT